MALPITITGNNYSEALAASTERALETGAVAIHAYDDARVLAGQGTLGMEFEEQVRGLDSVLIAVGGGGLIGGVAAWYQERVRVIGVEPERAPTLHKSLAAGQVVDVETGGVAADSLGARRVGELMFPIAQKFVPQSLLVSDEQIIEAQAHSVAAIAFDRGTRRRYRFLRPCFPAFTNLIQESALAWCFAVPMRNLPVFQRSLSARPRSEPNQNL